MERPESGEVSKSFPRHGKFRGGARPEQKEILQIIDAALADHYGEEECIVVIEAPTGVGKSAVEYAALKAAAKHADGQPMFWIVPTKALVDQFKDDFPGLRIIYGSNEIPCMFAAEGFDPETLHPTTQDGLEVLYHDPKATRRDDVPCTMLEACGHRVNLDTGETKVHGATRCPFYQQMYEAKSGGIILCTMSFYLFERLFVQRFGDPAALVIDEAHRISDVIRFSLSFDITDWNLKQAVEMLERIEAEAEAKSVRQFLQTLRRITKARKRRPYEEYLLDEKEISRLLDVLQDLDTKELERKIREAVRAGKIKPKTEFGVMQKLQALTQNLRRYTSSLEYAIGTEKRRPLNYVCAFYRTEHGEEQRVQHKLVVRAHYVAPLVQRCLLAPFTLACSATIGKPETFAMDTGIEGTTASISSPFPVENTRLYLPTDVWDLSYQAKGSKRNKTRTLRRIAQACRLFASKGHRCLVVVISNEERLKFLELAEEENVYAVSYRNGTTAKDAVRLFREGGEGDVLVGTAANYAEGIDLPAQMAPVVFFLKPGYENPNSAMAQFELRRFPGSRVRKLRQWRVMLKALQVRGRNVRSPEDLGVTFFMNQQFRSFLRGSLPDWLKPAYRGDLSFDKAVENALELLG